MGRTTQDGFKLQSAHLTPHRKRNQAWPGVLLGVALCLAFAGQAPVSGAQASAGTGQPAAVPAPPQAASAKGGTAGAGEVAEGKSASTENAQPGLAVADGDRVKVRLGFMAGYGQDRANSNGGFERQGRVGYATVTVEGRPHQRLFYRMTLNPVDETAPLPGCGEPGMFYPNNPQTLYGAGPNVQCEVKNGNRRVDAYRFLSWDVAAQQGLLREAFVEFQATRSVSVRVGRTFLPLGFDWEEAGSMTAKDATRLQRINNEASFGVMLRYARQQAGRAKPTVSAAAAAFLGEGNRWNDYNYFYFEDESLDANSYASTMASVAVSPVDAVEIRAAFKYGDTGSKVERLPSYWASKRHDKAIIVGISYENRYLRTFLEGARYTWGPTASSAEMLGVDPWPVIKSGWWTTIEGRYPVSRTITAGVSWSREEVDRADALVKYLANKNLYRVSLGSSDRMTVIRLFTDIAPGVRLAFYKNFDSNPFPQASGIVAIAGIRAYWPTSTDKWGFVLRVRVQ